MTKDEIASNVNEVKNAWIAQSKNEGHTLDARAIVILDKCCNIVVAVTDAICTIARSQAHIAAGTERGWKPGDDVSK